MRIRWQYALIIGLALVNASARADVVEVAVQEWGPPMPLGPGETGIRLMGVGPAAKLDAHLTGVDVVHSELRDVRVSDGGQPKTVPMVYYFVRVRFDKAGCRQLIELNDAIQKQTPLAKSNGHTVRLSVRIDNSEQGDRMFIHRESETAELRLVLHKPQLLKLLAAVRQEWEPTESKSTVNRWVDGDVDFAPRRASTNEVPQDATE